MYCSGTDCGAVIPPPARVYRELARHDGIILTREFALNEQIDRELSGSQKLLSKHANFPGWRRMVPGTNHYQRNSLFRVGDLPVAIHGNQIGRSQVSESSQASSALVETLAMAAFSKIGLSA